MNPITTYLQKHSMITATDRGLMFWLYWYAKTRWFYTRIALRRKVEDVRIRVSWEWHYRLKGPSCTECGTREALVECFLDPRVTGKPDEYLCHDHVTQACYCWACGVFSAGVGGWEMRSSGLCDDCADELREDDYEDDGYPYYYEPSDNGWEPEFDYDFDDEGED